MNVQLTELNKNYEEDSSKEKTDILIKLIGASYQQTQYIKII